MTAVATSRPRHKLTGKPGETCTKHGCGSILIAAIRASEGGVAGVECPGCNRRAMGLCRDCDLPLNRKGAARCGACAKKRQRALNAERGRRIYRENRGGYRDKQIAYQHRRREDPAQRALDAQRARERAKRKPKKERTHWDRLKERARKLAQPYELTAAQKKRRADRVRERYHTEPEFRKKRQAYVRQQHARRVRSPEVRAARNARARERYAADAALRERHQAMNKAYRERRRAERQGAVA